VSAAIAPALEKTNITNSAPQNDEARWRTVMELPCQLTVDLVFPGCTVQDFLALGVGSVLSTNWGISRDLPLKVNGILIAWGELEGTADSLSIRITELA